MSADLYTWAISPQWGRRHLARELAPGDVPGRSGMAACGRPVMDAERAVYWWRRQHTTDHVPDIKAIPACGSCVRLSGLVMVADTSGPDLTLADYARRANAAETAMRKHGLLLREILAVFGPGHDLTGRNPEHSECRACRVLKRARLVLASTEQAGHAL